jgi:hypothetical protein
MWSSSNADGLRGCTSTVAGQRAPLAVRSPPQPLLDLRRSIPVRHSRHSHDSYPPFHSSLHFPRPFSHWIPYLGRHGTDRLFNSVEIPRFRWYGVAKRKPIEFGQMFNGCSCDLVAVLNLSKRGLEGRSHESGLSALLDYECGIFVERRWLHLIQCTLQLQEIGMESALLPWIDHDIDHIDPTCFCSLKWQTHVL